MTVQDVGAALAEYRDVREQLERSILPLATSVDGRRFTYQTSLHGLELEAGGYVAIEGDGGTRLGQLLSLEFGSDDASGPGLPQVRIRFGRGEGAVLDGRRAAVPRRHRAAGPVRRGGGVARADATGARAPSGGRAGPRRRSPVRARRHRIRPPHVPVRPVGLGEDVLAGRAAGKAPAGDEPSRGGARPELGLRPARRDDRRGGCDRDGALHRGGGLRGRAERHGRRGLDSRAVPGAQPRAAGGRPATGSARRPRGVRRPDGRARERALRGFEDLARVDLRRAEAARPQPARRQLGHMAGAGRCLARSGAGGPGRPALPRRRSGLARPARGAGDRRRGTCSSVCGAAARRASRSRS